MVHSDLVVTLVVAVLAAFVGKGLATRRTRTENIDGEPDCQPKGKPMIIVTFTDDTKRIYRDSNALVELDANEIPRRVKMYAATDEGLPAREVKSLLAKSADFGFWIERPQTQAGPPRPARFAEIILNHKRGVIEGRQGLDLVTLHRWRPQASGN